MSLVDLVQQHNLPSHQYMDKETLGWILKNQPDFKLPFENLKYDKQTADQIITHLTRYSPKLDWFLNQKGINTIHGIRHILRVTINVFNLCNEFGYDNKILYRVSVAANLHDLRRIDDKGDKNHGVRAIEWFIENKSILERHYDINFNQNDTEAILVAIELHEISYTNFSDKQKDFYQTHKILVDLMKTADALDRYRLPKLKWWIDDEYLQLLPTNRLKALAYKLVTISEDFYLSGLNNQKSVVKAIQHLNNYEI